MDHIDQAWVDSIIPADAIPEGYVAAVAYLMPNGTSEVRIHFDGELQLSNLLGMAEMAKVHLVRTFLEDTDDDDDD